MTGKEIALSDWEKYKKGEMTKEELEAACQFSIWWANYATEENDKAAEYLYTMQELGFIKVRIND